MQVLYILLSAFVLSFLFTWYLRGYAIRHKIIDIPNQRSSHSTPTPRGGGIAIVITFQLLLIVFFIFDLVNLNQMLGLFIAGTITSIIGFADDHGHIAARWRLLAHFLAAGIGLFYLGKFPVINLFSQTNISLGWIGIVLGLIYLVWMLNLYNFMDGINGLSSVEAVTFSISSLCILYFNIPNAAETSEFISLIILGGSTFGFMLWNFPIARIFMGDAGSGFLGIILGLLVLYIANLNVNFFIAELCLLGIFIVDSTITLFRRLLNRKKAYEAHSSHCYQILSRKYNSHKLVTITAIIINLFWLTPIAMLIASGKLVGIIGIIIAWAPLTIIVIRSGAGIKDRTRE